MDDRGVARECHRNPCWQGEMMMIWLIPVRGKVDLRVMITKEYTLAKVPWFEPYHKMQFSVISGHSLEGWSYPSIVRQSAYSTALVDRTSDNKYKLLTQNYMLGEGLMVKVLEYGIVVREFELQSRYYVHFRTNTLRKGMCPLILPSMG